MKFSVFVKSKVDGGWVDEWMDGFHRLLKDCLHKS